MQIFTRGLSFIDNIISFCVETENERIYSILSLTDSVAEISPATPLSNAESFNIISAIGVDENAVSRILKTILSYKYKGTHPILASFLNSFINSNVRFSSPHFTAEEMRIDLLVREPGGKAIIFENKYNNAVMQNNQLSRYINKVKEIGYKEENIYIVFLPRDNNGNPSDCGWRNPSKYCELCDGIKNDNCKYAKSQEEAFADRYIKVSFKEDIICWLRELLSQDLDYSISSNIATFLDFLEQDLKARKIDNEMDNKVKDHIKHLLAFNGDEISDHSLITEKIKELKSVESYLNELEEEYRNKCLSRLALVLEQEKGFIVDSSKLNDRRYPQIRIHKHTNDEPYSAFICADTYNKQVIIGVCSDEEEGIVISKALLAEEIEKLCTSYGYAKGKHWLAYKTIEFSNAIDCMSEIADILGLVPTL